MTALTVFVSSAATYPAWGRPPGDGTGGPPAWRMKDGRHGHEPQRKGAWLQRLTDELDLDDDTRASVRAVIEAGRERTGDARKELKAARVQMHGLLQADQPDEAEVLAQVERIGTLRTALHKQRMQTMLRVHALLSPEQRAILLEMFKKRRGPGKRGPRHSAGWRGEHEPQPETTP